MGRTSARVGRQVFQECDDLHQVKSLTKRRPLTSPVRIIRDKCVEGRAIRNITSSIGDHVKRDLARSQFKLSIVQSPTQVRFHGSYHGFLRLSQFDAKRKDEKTHLVFLRKCLLEPCADAAMLGQRQCLL